MTYIPTPAQTAAVLNAGGNVNARVAQIASALAEVAQQNNGARRSYAETVATTPKTPPTTAAMMAPMPPPSLATRPVVPARGGPVQPFTVRQVSPTPAARKRGSAGGSVMTGCTKSGNRHDVPASRRESTPPAAGRVRTFDGIVEAETDLPHGPSTPLSSPRLPQEDAPSPASSDDLWRQMMDGPFHSHIPSPVPSEEAQREDTDAVGPPPTASRPLQARDRRERHTTYVPRGHKRARAESSSPPPPERAETQLISTSAPPSLLPPPILACTSNNAANHAGRDVETPQRTRAIAEGIPRPRSNIHELLNPRVESPSAAQPGESHDQPLPRNTPVAPERMWMEAPKATYRGTAGDGELMEWTPSSPARLPAAPILAPIPHRHAADDGRVLRRSAPPPLLASFVLPPPLTGGGGMASQMNARNVFRSTFPPIPETDENAMEDVAWNPTPEEPYPGANSRRRLPLRDVADGQGLPPLRRAPSMDRLSPPPQTEWAASPSLQHTAAERVGRTQARSMIYTAESTGALQPGIPHYSARIAFTPPPNKNGFELPELEDPEALIDGLSAPRAQALSSAGPLAAALARVYNVVRPDPSQTRQIANAIEAAVRSATGEPEPQAVPPETERQAPRDLMRYPGTWVIRNIAPESVAKILRRKVWSCDGVTFFAYPTEVRIPRYLFSLDGFDPIKPGDPALFNAVWEAIVSEGMREKTIRLALATARFAGRSDEYILSCLLSSLVVHIEDLGNGRQIAAVKCDSPTDMVHLWRDWRRSLEGCSFTTTWHGTAEVRRPERCKACHGADHPTHICPFQYIPGWRAPPPGEAFSFAAALPPPPPPPYQGRNWRSMAAHPSGPSGRRDGGDQSDGRRAGGGGRREAKMGKGRVN
ncbi:hypothetical protein OH77DRAFT_1511827 [Trametes cingulata]|nr:hypothetical protein OH77DRAFT_1511827 [Trametes cingulata]